MLRECDLCESEHAADEIRTAGPDALHNGPI